MIPHSVARSQQWKLPILRNLGAYLEMTLSFAESSQSLYENLGTYTQAEQASRLWIMLPPHRALNQQPYSQNQTPSAPTYQYQHPPRPAPIPSP